MSSQLYSAKNGPRQRPINSEKLPKWLDAWDLPFSHAVRPTVCSLLLVAILLALPTAPLEGAGPRKQVEVKTYQFTDEDTIKKDWDIVGPYRIERTGIRLFNTPKQAALVSKDRFEGDAAFEVYTNTGIKMVMRIWGHGFGTPPHDGRWITRVEKRGDTAVLMSGRRPPEVVKLQRAMADTADHLKITLEDDPGKADIFVEAVKIYVAAPPPVAKTSQKERPAKPVEAASRGERAVPSKPRRETAKVYHFTDEATIKQNWQLLGDCRVEATGLRLNCVSDGRSVLVSDPPKSFHGNVTIEITCSMDVTCFVNIWETLFKLPTESGRAVIVLTRRDDTLSCTCNGTIVEAAKANSGGLQEGGTLRIYPSGHKQVGWMRIESIRITHGK